MSKEKIVRMSNFIFRTGDTEYKLPVTPDSPYVVDDSNFVPIAEAIKQLGNGNNGAGKLDQFYDFPDGKDSGQPIPFSRSSEFKDIAELSTEVSNNINDIKSKIDEQEKLNEVREKVKQDLAPSPSNE